MLHWKRKICVLLERTTLREKIFSLVGGDRCRVLYITAVSYWSVSIYRYYHFWQRYREVRQMSPLSMRRSVEKCWEEQRETEFSNYFLITIKYISSIMRWTGESLLLDHFPRIKQSLLMLVVYGTLTSAENKINQKIFSSLWIYSCFSNFPLFKTFGLYPYYVPSYFPYP